MAFGAVCTTFALRVLLPDVAVVGVLSVALMRRTVVLVLVEVPLFAIMPPKLKSLLWQTVK